MFWFWVLPALLVLSGCSGEPDAVMGDARRAGEHLATQGRDGIPPCSSCHGPKGEGQATFPRLAGQHPLYLVKQLEDFARVPPRAGVVVEPIARDYSATPRIYSDLTVFSPGIREDAVMGPIARQLSKADRRNLALYYASLPFDATPVPADFQTLERGQDLALRGKPEYGVPGCVTCHGPDGRGFEADFPPLAGQPAAYLVGQIDRWQSGQRDNDPQRLMQTVANQLTDADKANVAAYFANLSANWPGYQGDWPWPE
ncbi:MAG: c-type cytochrome [Chromatiaceae bacterium]|nr:c-type cytochrome [Chromatiaceae bacterium]